MFIWLQKVINLRTLTGKQLLVYSLKLQGIYLYRFIIRGFIYLNVVLTFININSSNCSFAQWRLPNETWFSKTNSYVEFVTGKLPKFKGKLKILKWTNKRVRSGDHSQERGILCCFLIFKCNSIWRLRLLIFVYFRHDFLFLSSIFFLTQKLFFDVFFSFDTFLTLKLCDLAIISL